MTSIWVDEFWALGRSWYMVQVIRPYKLYMVKIDMGKGNLEAAVGE